MPHGSLELQIRAKKEIQRTNHQVKSRAEHVIDLSYIIGGTRHQVSNGLEVVKGHAFPQKINKQFLPNELFNILGDDFKSKVTYEM
jgi:hypothetical protein